MNDSVPPGTDFLKEFTYLQHEELLIFLSHTRLQILELKFYLSLAAEGVDENGDSSMYQKLKNMLGFSSAVHEESEDMFEEFDLDVSSPKKLPRLP
eukprot:1584081-Rhodomonas_salina.1